MDPGQGGTRMINTVYLTERNLRTLLSKLERKKSGEFTACTIIKPASDNPKFEQGKTIVVAVLDEEFYGSEGLDRPAGAVHPSDEPKH
jgi:hypothetical protein